MLFRIKADTLDTQGQVIDVGYVSTLEETYGTSLTQKAVMSLTSRDAIVVDTGIMRSYGISYQRVSPTEPDEASNDTTRWSNGHWLLWMLERVVDRFQAETDGQIISIIPDGDMAELYPPVSNLRCYISRFTYSYRAGQPRLISGDFQFDVGSYKLGKEIDNSIAYVTNFISIDTSLTDMDTCSVSQSTTAKMLEYPEVWYRYIPEAKRPISKDVIWWCLDTTTSYEEAKKRKIGWDQGGSYTFKDDRSITVYARYWR